MERPVWQVALAIAVGVGVAGAAVWGAVLTSVSPNCGSAWGGQTPLGSFMAFSPAHEAQQGSVHWYNFTVQSVAGSTHLDSLSFQVQTSVGAIVGPGPNWTAHMADDSEHWIATYSLSTAGPGNWSSGGDLLLTTQDVFDLMASPQNLSNQGDVLVVLIAESEVNGCSMGGGSVTVSIP